jgi:bifunctional enzyme CysN/CysC
VTLTLADEVDCSRGDMIASAGAASVAATIDATLVWMAEEQMVPHRSYWLKTGAQTVSASIGGVGPLVDINTLEARRGLSLGLNDIGRVEIDLDRRIAATSYEDNRSLGGFILIDKMTHVTVAAGMIGSFPKSGADKASDTQANRIFWTLGRDEAERNARATRLQAQLSAQGRSALILTEALVRGGVCADLGPDQAEELTRRVAEVARLMSMTGATVIAAIPVAEGVTVAGTMVEFEGEGEAPDANWII